MRRPITIATATAPISATSVVNTIVGRSARAAGSWCLIPSSMPRYDGWSPERMVPRSRPAPFEIGIRRRDVVTAGRGRRDGRWPTIPFPPPKGAPPCPPSEQPASASPPPSSPSSLSLQHKPTATAVQTPPASPAGLRQQLPEHAPQLGAGRRHGDDRRQGAG